MVARGIIGATRGVRQRNVSVLLTVFIRRYRDFDLSAPSCPVIGREGQRGLIACSIRVGVNKTTSFGDSVVPCPVIVTVTVAVGTLLSLTPYDLLSPSLIVNCVG